MNFDDVIAAIANFVEITGVADGEFALCGGAALVMMGCRDKTDDLDIVVAPWVLERIKNDMRWEECELSGFTYFRHGIFEVSDQLFRSNYDFQDLLLATTPVIGVSRVCDNMLLEQKHLMAADDTRPLRKIKQDLEDIGAIRQYMRVRDGNSRTLESLNTNYG